MQAFKTKAFARWARAAGLGNDALATAVAEMKRGLIDARLGGQVVKKRVALPGRGKRGGVRTLVAFKQDDKAFFIFGFAKNEPANVGNDELEALKLLAKELLNYPAATLRQALEARELIEIEVKTMAKKRVLDTVHETAKGLHKAGVMDTKTMREFDALCLPPVKNLSPTQIKRLRTRNRVSQAVFAAYLNTSPSTVQKWEQGQKKPNGPSLKLLNLVEKKGLEVLE